MAKRAWNKSGNGSKGSVPRGTPSADTARAKLRRLRAGSDAAASPAPHLLPHDAQRSAALLLLEISHTLIIRDQPHSY